MTDFVQPVTLPAQMELTPEGTDCIVTGWGTLHVSFCVRNDFFFFYILLKVL